LFSGFISAEYQGIDDYAVHIVIITVLACYTELKLNI